MNPSFHARTTFQWQLRTRSLLLGDRTLLMAIVNITPDSFSGDGLLPASPQAIAQRVVDLVDAGADIVDLGAESTRPNATALSAADEQQRLLPVLAASLAARPTAILSVDTYHAETARAAAALGAEIINDVSGGEWGPGHAARDGADRLRRHPHAYARPPSAVAHAVATAGFRHRSHRLRRASRQDRFCSPGGHRPKRHRDRSGLRLRQTWR